MARRSLLQELIMAAPFGRRFSFLILLVLRARDLFKMGERGGRQKWANRWGKDEKEEDIGGCSNFSAKLNNYVYIVYIIW